MGVSPRIFKDVLIAGKHDHKTFVKIAIKNKEGQFIGFCERQNKEKTLKQHPGSNTFKIWQTKDRYYEALNKI